MRKLGLWRVIEVLKRFSAVCFDKIRKGHGKFEGTKEMQVVSCGIFCLDLLFMLFLVDI